MENLQYSKVKNTDKENIKILNSIFNKDQDLKSLESKLIQASINNNQNAVIQLIEQITLTNNANPLIYSAQFGYSEAIDFFIKKDKQNLNKKDNNGETALMHAARNGNIKIATKLFNYKQNINEINNFGYTALMIAIENEHQDIINLLLKQKDIDINKTNKFGWTALMFAAKFKNTEVVKILVEKEANINKKDFLGRSAITIAHQYNNYEIENYLNKKLGENINKIDKSILTKSYVKSKIN